MHFITNLSKFENIQELKEVKTILRTYAENVHIYILVS